MWGLYEMYVLHPDKKWYYIVGCDSYIHEFYTLEMLSDVQGAFL
jgi:hypothetical protein